MKMYLYNFFISLHFIGAVLVPFYTEWAGLTLTHALILQSWFLFSVFLLEIPSGTFADYFGRKNSIVLAVLANIAGALVYSFIPNFFLFMIGEFLWALAVALMSGADYAMLYDTLRKTKKTKNSKKIFSRYESSGLLGLMVGAPVGSFIASIYGLQAPMFYLIVPFSIAFFIALTFKEPSCSRTKEKNYLEILRKGVKYFYKHKILKILALDMIVISTASYFMIWLYQPLLTNVGINIAYFGVVQATLVLSEILIMNNFDKLEKLFGSKRRLLFFSSIITGLMFVLGGLTLYLPIVLMVIIIGGGFGLSRKPLFNNYYNKYIPSDKRATVLSSISMINRFSIAIVNPFVGILADWSLSYTFIIIGTVAIIFSFVSRIEEDMLVD